MDQTAIGKWAEFPGLSFSFKQLLKTQIRIHIFVVNANGWSSGN